MKLSVSNKAANWYKEELGLDSGDHLQYKIQLYGQSIHPNYSLGIATDPPRDMSVHTVVEGITFYFERQDAWFLQDHHLHVDVVDDEIEYRFEKIED